MGNLPLEVLNTIISFIKDSDRRHSLRNCSLVCKSWNQPSQLALFSKVVIKDDSKLKNLVKTLKSNTDLSNAVKELHLDLETRPRYEESTFEQVFNYLPKLEIFGSNHRIDYLTITDALIDFKLPHLKKFAISPLTEEDFDSYVTCARLMRDRIESLALYNTVNIDQFRNISTNSDITRSFDRLYNTLDEFPKVKEILVTVNTNDPIDILETVTERCSQLRTIRLEIAYRFIRHAYSLSKIRNYIPRPNIKILRGVQLQFNNSNILLYFMHKYPQLQCLHLDSKQKNNPTILQKEIAKQFLVYLSKINRVTVYGICLGLNDLCDTLGSFWRNKSNPRAVEIRYGEGWENIVTLNFVKNGTAKIPISIEYDRDLGDTFGHERLFEGVGESLQSVVMKNFGIKLPLEAHQSTANTFYGNFISHALNNCPNLIDLDVVNFELKEIDFSRFVLSDHKIRFRTLGILQSRVKNSVFRDLSSVFSTIKHLNIAHNKYYFDEYTNRYYADLNMINTAIQVLTIDFGNQKSKRAYLKIFTTHWNEYRYFKCDYSNGMNGAVQASSEGEYKDKRDFFVHVRCKVLGRLVLHCTVPPKFTF